MKKCLNCDSNIKDGDIYCRHCGCLIQSNKNYILVNIMIFILAISNILLIVLFTASILVYR